MLERELLVLLDPRKRLAPDQVARLEGVKHLRKAGGVAVELLECAAPEHLAHD